MKNNPNTEYERFTQEIYQQLANLDVVRTTTVMHNVKLAGRSGQKHQIDVYWEYENNGKKDRIAIECKNYSRRVSLEKVCAFKGVLDDLEGVSGIMVSKEGFQRGAIKYAQKYHISLKELRAPRTREETIIGEFENRIHIESRHTLYMIDEGWASKHDYDIPRFKRRLDSMRIENDNKWSNSTHVPLTLEDRIIRNCNGVEITSLDKLEELLPSHITDEYPYIFHFEDAYVSLKGGGILKILEVKYEYEIRDESQTIAINADFLVKAILKDSLNNKTDFFALY